MARLLVSFWDITLENFPVGVFTHREVTPEEAKLMIDVARTDKSLVGVTGDDLFAPFAKDRQKRHEEMRAVLREHYGITLEDDDFSSEDEVVGNPNRFQHALALYQISAEDSLMVITCTYEMKKGRSFKPSAFQVAADSIEFHLFTGQ